MRYLLTLLAVLACSACFAQSDTVSYFLDQDWKKCKVGEAMYFRVAVKEGNWWRVKDYYFGNGQLQMNGLFSTYERDTFKSKQGMFYYYHQNGVLSEKARFIDDKHEGVVKIYNEDGRIIDSGLYKKGIPYKAKFSWFGDGKLEFKGVYAEDGSGIGEEWEYHENGNISSYGKTGLQCLKDSVWTYYYKSGAISSVEHYEKDSLLSIKCFAEDGKPLNNCLVEKMPEPGYDLSMYFSSNLIYPELAIKNEVEGRTNVLFVVNEDGRITNVKLVSRRIGSGCDEEAIRLVSEMPKWKPGVQHSRPVKVYYRQPISFRLL